MLSALVDDNFIGLTPEKVQDELENSWEVSLTPFNELSFKNFFSKHFSRRLTGPN